MTDADFREAFHQHKGAVFRYAYRMTGENATAEDVVQDCFAALWKKPEAFDPLRGSLRAFLLGIARNLVFKRWRKERSHDVLEEDCAVFLPPDAVHLERVELVKRAVLALPPLQRETLILAEYEEMPLQEIAAATAAELAAVKSRLHRARENLRRMLAPLLEQGGHCHANK